MFNKEFIFSLLIAVSTIMSACGSKEKQLKNEETTEANSLIVACDATASKGVILGGERLGYSYELLKAYAEARGSELYFTDSRTLARSSEQKADITISMHNGAAEYNANYISEPLYSTNYVVLTSSTAARNIKKSGAIGMGELFADYDIYVVAGFQYTKGYDTLLDSMKTARIYVSPKDASELAKNLTPKSHSLLICEKSDAMLITELTRNISQLYEFEERVHINAFFAEEERGLRDDFREWYMGFQMTDAYASLENSYMGDSDFGKFLLAQTGTKSARPANGTISKWDTLIREVGTRESVDWRLLSAIAYHESRFNADAVSRQGARGLMQIMPIVADHFKISREELSNPEVNIMLAAKLIKNIEKTLRFGSGVKSEDKMSIILAAYNCGVGNVANARKIAARDGADADSWTTVASYLVRMCDKEYVNSFDISRTFNNASHTLAYVDNVISKYRSYCTKVRL